jgi:hypothetical protein
MEKTWTWLLAGDGIYPVEQIRLAGLSRDRRGSVFAVRYQREVDLLAQWTPYAQSRSPLRLGRSLCSIG